jgi:hypothetical protein
MSPFTASCGGCFYCARGKTCRCQHPQAQLFGWVNEPGAGAGGQVRRPRHQNKTCAELGGATPPAAAEAHRPVARRLPPQAAPSCQPPGLHGSQAQYVRVPLADSTLVKVRRREGAGWLPACSRHPSPAPAPTLAPSPTRRPAHPYPPGADP